MGKRTKKTKTDKYNFFFKIDKKRLKKLSIEESVHYFESLIERILAAPVLDPVMVTINGNKYEVSNKDSVVFLEAYKGLLSYRILWEKEKSKVSYRIKELASRMKENISNLNLGSEVDNSEKQVGYDLVKNGVAFALSGLMVINSVSPLLKSNKNVAILQNEGKSHSNYLEDVKKDGSREKMITFIEELAEEKARIAEAKRQKVFDSYIEEYCLYLNLDSKKVIEIARTLTNDYTESFDDLIGSEIFTPTSDEAACLIFVYRLYRNTLTVKLSEFGLERSDLKIDDSIYGNDREKGEELILRNGLTGTQFMGRICDLLNMDKYYALSISYLEAGKKFSSKICRNKNNFGGMRSSGEFLTYSSPEEGIIAFCMNLKNYEKFGFTSIEELSGKYVNGDKNKPSPTWVNNVLGYYRMFTENPEEYFLMDFETEQEVEDHAMVMTPVSQRIS